MSELLHFAHLYKRHPGFVLLYICKAVASGNVGLHLLSSGACFSSASGQHLGRLQHTLDHTPECLNLDGTDDDSSFED